MAKKYSTQEALDFLDSLQKSKSEITKTEYEDCCSIVSDLWMDDKVAAGVEDVIKSQLKHINLDDNNESLSYMLGDLECQLNIRKNSDEGGLVFPVYADIVNNYLSEQMLSKAKSEKNSSPVLFVRGFEFFYEDTVNPNEIDSCFTEAIDNVYLKGEDGKCYAVDISDSYNGDYHAGLAREDVGKLNGLIRGFSDGQNVVLNYDKNKSCCDVIDKSQEYNFEVLSNDAYIKEGKGKKNLVTKNSKTGKFELQEIDLKNIDLYDVANSGFSDGIDILLGERINQQEKKRTCVIFAKDENGKVFLDAEFPAREAGTGFERIDYVERGVMLSYRIENDGVDKTTDFRYVREKNGKSYLARRASGERGYTIVDKIYKNNMNSKVDLEEKMKRIKEHLDQKGLDMGKTGDSRNVEVSEKHKKVAAIQKDYAKQMILQKKMQERKISGK